MPSEQTIEVEKAPAPPQEISADVENVAGFDKDIAVAIVGERRHDINPAVEARVVRKIDWFLIPAMSIGYGLVYYDKVSTSSLSVTQVLTFPGNSWFRSSVRHDHRPLPRSNRLQNNPGLQRYLPSLLGYLNVLLRHASRSLPHDLRTAKIQYGQNTWQHRLLLGIDLHANCSRNKLAGTLRSTFLSWLRREYHTNELHVHYLLILYPEGTGFATELVVLGYRGIHNCWRSPELWIWSDQGWSVETLAVYLPVGWIPHVPLWVGLLCRPEFARHGVVLDQGRTRCCYGALKVWADWSTVHEVQALPDP